MAHPQTPEPISRESELSRGSEADDDAELIASLKEAAWQSNDPILTALIEVLASAHEEWSRWRGVANVQRRTYERAESAVRESRRRLDVLLEAATRMGAASDVGRAATLPAETRPDDASHAGAHELRAQLLGRTRLLFRGTSIEQPGGKLQTLLVYLIANRRRPVSRDALVDLLWPDADAAAGRRNLHQLVYALRRLLRATRETDGSVIVYEQDHYCLNPGLTTWVDTEEFDRLVTKGRRHDAADESDEAIDEYLRAEALYRGEFLEDLPYDDWPIAERTRLGMAHVELVDRLSDLLLARDRVDEAIDVSQRLLTRDPGHEAAHRTIMRAFLSRGDRGRAVRQYRTLAEIMDREYGLAPSTETTELFNLASG